MGTSLAGIFIKLDPASIKVDTIVNDLFGKIKNKSNVCSQDYNLRNTNTVGIVTLDKGIVILDPAYGEEVLVQGGEKLDKLNEYFKRPEYMLAFMNFDSGNGYGFRYVEQGETIRYKHVNGWFVTTEYGEPLDEEMKYLNAYYYKDEEEDNMVIYNFSGKREEDGMYTYMMQDLTLEVMLSKVGLTFHDAELIKILPIIF